jgi:hypothetical protein
MAKEVVSRKNRAGDIELSVSVRACTITKKLVAVLDELEGKNEARARVLETLRARFGISFSCFSSSSQAAQGKESLS